MTEKELDYLADKIATKIIKLYLIQVTLRLLSFHPQQMKR
jgi:hypothetical protein